MSLRTWSAAFLRAALRAARRLRVSSSTSSSSSTVSAGAGIAAWQPSEKSAGLFHAVRHSSASLPYAAPAHLAPISASHALFIASHASHAAPSGRVDRGEARAEALGAVLRAVRAVRVVARVRRDADDDERGDERARERSGHVWA